MAKKTAMKGKLKVSSKFRSFTHGFLELEVSLSGLLKYGSNSLVMYNSVATSV